MKRLAIAYFVALHLAVSYLGWRAYVHAHQTWPLMETIHSQMDPQVPAGSVLFLGDSIVQGLVTAAVAPNSVDYGISGQRSDQLIRTMDNYRSMERAAAVVVLIGTNDLRANMAEGIQQRYSTILSKIPPHVPVVLGSPPPLRGRDASVARVAALRACAADARCTFADVQTALDRPGMLGPDGVHLSQQGYEALIHVLRASLTTAGTARPPAPARSTQHVQRRSCAPRRRRTSQH